MSRQKSATPSNNFSAGLRPSRWLRQSERTSSFLPSCGLYPGRWRQAPKCIADLLLADWVPFVYFKETACSARPLSAEISKRCNSQSMRDRDSTPSRKTYRDRAVIPYAIVERPIGIPNNRSNAIESYVPIDTQLSTYGFVSWQHTHGD